MFAQTATAPPPLSAAAAAAAASPASPTTTTTRSGRLRGLSYLRNYTHNHLHSHSSSNSSSNPNPHPNNSDSPSPSPAAHDQAHSSQGPSHNRSPLVAPAERASKSSSATGRLASAEPVDQINPSTGHGATSGWLPTVGGRSGLSRVASRPQPTATSPPAAELCPRQNSTADANSNLASSMSRSREGSAQHGQRDGPTAVYSQAAREFATLGGVAPQLAAVGSALITPSPSTSREGREQQTSNEVAVPGGSVQTQMPSIRFIPHQDPRSSRPSLNFGPVSRTLPSSSAVIRVGRYSEKDNDALALPSAPSAAPVGFKSKVVSRRHCELWCSSGQWYIKDVKSSSGTFLNHIRLSQPNLESKPFPVNDGDVIQLGIDFKGGEEMIFRCVKIRVECNRGWQKALNSFNTTTHKRLRGLAAKNAATDSMHSSECSICLLSIAPCQPLFVAPCSHVWHYKCIRPILNGSTWPQFLCPNCRAVADLEAEVDEPMNWESELDEMDDTQESSNRGTETETHSREPSQEKEQDVSENGRVNGVRSEDGLPPAFGSLSIAGEAPSGSNPDPRPHAITTDERLERPPVRSPSSISSRKLESVQAIQIPSPTTPTTASSVRTAQTQGDHAGPSAVRETEVVLSVGSNLSEVTTDSPGQEGPVTPRNDAGPFVFDGSAGRASERSTLGDVDEAEPEV